MNAYCPTTALAQAVFFDEDSMHVHLTDGRTVSVPLLWFPRLHAARPKQRRQVAIGGGSRGLHWVPPQHLDAVYQLVHALTVRPAQEAATGGAVERIMGAAEMLSDRSDAEWATFEAKLQRSRMQLFNRPLPDFDADAA